METDADQIVESARPSWRSGFTRVLHMATQRTLAFVYPPTCIACSAATDEPHRLCGACWASIRFIEAPFCQRLGHPFAADGGQGLVSPAALADPPAFGRARAAAVYDGAARRMIQAFKYNDSLDLSRGLASMTVRAGHELLSETDVLVPIPLHWGRLWRRRFNQAAILAGLIAQTSGVPSDPFLLKRLKATRTQTALTKAQRRDNLRGAFVVPAEARAKVAGRRILLIDDVVTTGATADAAARVLLRAGAVAVDVLSFACVVPGDGGAIGA